LRKVPRFFSKSCKWFIIKTGPNLTFGKLPLGILHIWEVATWEIVTWEVAIGKMPLGKYLTPSVKPLRVQIDPWKKWYHCR